MKLVQKNAGNPKITEYVVRGVAAEKLENGELPGEAILRADINFGIFEGEETGKFGEIGRVCRGQHPRWKLVEVTIVAGMLKLTFFDTEERGGANLQTLVTPLGETEFRVEVFAADFRTVVANYEVKGFANGPRDEDGDELVTTILETVAGRPAAFARFVRGGAFKETRLDW